MPVKDFEEALMQYDAFKARKALLLYVPPVLLSIGTFGNVLSFVILARSMSKVSTYVYLTCLAVVDLLVLYIGLLRLWIGEIAEVDVKNHGTWMCKLTIFLGYVFSNVSVWLLVAVTIERFIVVWCPFRANHLCTVCRAKFVIGLLAFVFVSINAHFLWTVELSQADGDGGHYVCYATTGFHHLIGVLQWVDATIFAFIPILTITFLNLLIILKVFLARKHRQRLQWNGNNDGIANQLVGRSTEKNKKLTIMLLTVSFTFVITTLPMCVVTILLSLGSNNQPSERLAQEALAQTVTELLMYFSHSVNFFLYCATGTRFQKQCIAILVHRKKPEQAVTLRTAIRLTNVNSEHCV